jgi:rhomboid family GlyGly-CTERM serine protease
VTIAFVLIAAVAGLPAGLPGALQYDRGRVAAGAFWLLFTAQFVHWSARMALADLGATLIVGAALESRSRPLLVAAGVLSILCVGTGLPLLAPGLAVYRGASGIASGLFVALALDIILESLRAGSTRARLRLAVGAVAFVLFTAKIMVEMSTGAAIFAGDLGPGVEVLPTAHLLGAVAGSVAAIGMRVGRRGRREGGEGAGPGPTTTRNEGRKSVDPTGSQP